MFNVNGAVDAVSEVIHKWLYEMSTSACCGKSIRKLMTNADDMDKGVQ